jgi:type 1 fimbria pilin
MLRILLGTMLGWLACMFMPGLAKAAECTGGFPAGPTQTVNFGQIVVPANLGVGGTIAYLGSTPMYTSPSFCMGYTTITVSHLLSMWQTPSGVASVYNTNIPGVGIKITAGQPIPYSDTETYDARGYQLVDSGMGVYLIKTGPITSSGTLSSGIIAQFALGPSHTVIYSIQIIGSSIVAPPPPTCDFNTDDANKTVTLKDVTVRAFNGVGATAQPEPFTLTAENCSSTAVSATYTFSGTADASNPELFTNSAGNAKGVGIHLYSTSDNQTIRADGTNNARTVGVSGGKAVLNLTAEYQQSQPTVTAGTVSGIATVVLNYN